MVDINDIEIGGEYIFYDAFEDKLLMGKIKEIIPEKRRAIFINIREQNGSPIETWKPERKTSVPLFEVIRLVTKKTPVGGSE